jgi:hypothetical protein
MTLDEMAKISKLKIFDGISKGEKNKSGKRTYSYSRVEYKFIKETSYELEESLNMLLDELENDKKGIKKLVKETDALIEIIKYQYVSANAGITIDRETIKRLEKLNLEIDIDMYISGKEFIS